MRLLTETQTAERLEDLASRLDAGLGVQDADSASAHATAGSGARAAVGAALGGSHAGHAPGREPAVATLRRQFTLPAWEWSTLAAAETAGALPAVLRHLAATHRERGRLRREVVGALAYPIVVLSLCGLVFGAVMAAGVAPRGWMILTITLLVSGLGGGAWLAWRLRDPGLDGDRLPGIGRLTRCAAEIPYLIALRALYGAGVPVRRAHPEAAPAARVPWVRARLFLVTQGLEAGSGFADALEKQQALTAESLTLVRNGEIQGQLEEALGKAASRRQEEYARFVRRATRVLGIVAYAYAAGSVLWIALRFYGGYYGALRSH